MYICELVLVLNGLQNAKECSMSYRQSKLYKLQRTSKNYHYSLLHPKGIFR